MALDSQLENLSQMVSEDEPRGVLNYEIQQNGRVDVMLKSGKSLDEILPKGYWIRYEKDVRPRIIYYSIWVDPEKLSSPYYRAQFAHEFGHVLDEEASERSHEEFVLDYEAGTESFDNKSSEEKLGHLSKLFRLRMLNEIAAWDHGKLVADALGVDDSSYDDAMSDGIQGHYSAEFDYLGYLVDRYCSKITGATALRIFNPFSHTDDEISYVDFKKLIQKMEPLNREALKNCTMKTNGKPVISVEDEPGDAYEVDELVQMIPEEVQSVKRAMSMVWRRNVGKPSTFKVVFASRIVDAKTEKDTGWSAEYDPDSDVFRFGVHAISEHGMDFGLPLWQALIILAAHEATHKWQVYRGDSPRPSPRMPVMDQYYAEDRHEKEAWEEALHVFKKIFPDSSGSFTTMGRKYEVPPESKYSSS